MAKATSFWFSTKGFCALVFIGAVTYFLLTEHQAHLYQWLPYLILLLCPLMHVFMHRGHGQHGQSREDGGDSSSTHQHHH